MPVRGTVQASVRPIGQSRRAANSIAAMNMRFISTGTKEASVNRPPAFSTPDSSATSEMNRM
jgi:hypothetical protein